MILLSVSIALLYLGLIGSLVYGFKKIERFKLKGVEPKTKFSILIPFRNEAENLMALLHSIEALNYPKTHFEVIFIDDESDDHSASIIQEHRGLSNIKVIANERRTLSPKKDAITTAIKTAKNEWIITTDADCMLPKYWLDCFNECIENTTPICIAAPVTYIDTKDFLNQFQILDLLSLQGATIGGFGIHKPFLCNGANFGYQKSVFLELEGFVGNSDIASGDDIFLLEKIAKNHPQGLCYLKSRDAIVLTKSQPTWKTLTSQRLRWAAKTTSYKNEFGRLTGLLVLLMNLLMLLLIILTFTDVFEIKTTLFILGLKFVADLFLIYQSATFFNQKEVLKSFPLAFFIYPLLSFYVASLSFFKGYTWKGRRFKK